LRDAKGHFSAQLAVGNEVRPWHKHGEGLFEPTSAMEFGMTMSAVTISVVRKHSKLLRIF
jgi:hypothetical protein